MKTILNFLLAVLFFSFFSDLKAQNNYNVSNLIAKNQANVSVTPNSSVQLEEYFERAPKVSNPSDCVLLTTILSLNFINEVKNSSPYTRAFSSASFRDRNGAPVSSFQFGLKYVNNNYTVVVTRTNNQYLVNKLPMNVTYDIEDTHIFVGSTRTCLNMLISDSNVILFSDSESVTENETNIRFRTSPLFFGLDSDDIKEITQRNTSIFINANNYDLKPTIINNKSSETLTLSYPTDNFNTIVSNLFGSKYTGNIVNARMSGPSKGETLSLDNPAIVSTLKIYPNPSNGQFSVDFPMNQTGNVSFEIVDIKGQKVFEQTELQFAQGSATHVLDTKGTLTSGIYLLKVTAPNFSETTRLILK
jgi:Secretion system C-terminal sorting domain